MSTLPTITDAPDRAARRSGFGTLRLYYLLFFLSGFPALIYQIVWQRALFTLYGVDVESVTLIVTVFMLGLGLGGLAGGWLSARKRIRLLFAFGVVELAVGAFGAASLWLFHRVAIFTAGKSMLETGVVSIALLLLPTLLMGSTLPLLVEQFVRESGNVGASVGALYSVNTLGSGVACLAAALFVMRLMGEAGSVWLAVGIDVFVGLAAMALQRNCAPQERQERISGPDKISDAIPFWAGLLMAGSTGFIALAYEIIWYRLYSFTSASKATCFAKLLAFYLIGIAYGSLVVRDACNKRLGADAKRTLRVCAETVVLGALAAFLLGPALARATVHVNYELTFTFVFVAAALLGSAFPLLAHAAIGPEKNAGRNLGLLYLANIVGSTLGSFLVGFVVLNYWSTKATSLLLLCLGVIVAIALMSLAGPKARKGLVATGIVAAAILALCSGPLFNDLYERLLYGGHYANGTKLSEVVENRNGVIVVDRNGTVYGGGAYDGRFNTDLVNDTNGLFRCFAVAGFHAKPTDVLDIGLASGSWAQVLAGDSDIKDETIVEINPGYLPLIREHREVSSLLSNPKVHIYIDDGRRWLVSHPDRKFDFIVMNMTFNWRANASNLLSVEFMRLIRAHLKPGGVAYYNTTSSPEALVTGAREFPYAVRFWNFIAVSDSPLKLDKSLWREKLATYRVDGQPVFDFGNAYDRTRFNEVLSLADNVPDGMLESRSSLLSRYSGFPEITDNNMGTEWKHQ